MKVRNNLNHKRNRDRRWRVTPRIIKDDIRRRYAQMMINIVNSHDILLLQQFFVTYGGRMLELKKGFTKNDSVHLYGIDHVLTYWHLLMETAPDQVMSVGQVQIISQEGTDSTKVIGKYRVEFTKLFDLVTIVQALHQAAMTGLRHKVRRIL